MLLWLVFSSYMSFSRTRLRYMYNLSLMLFRLQAGFISSRGTRWLLNFSDDLFMLSWLDNLNNLGGCALRNMVDDISLLDSLWKNLFNNLSGSGLRDVLNNLLVLDSLGEDLFNNFSRSALRLFDNDISNFLFLW